MTHAEFDQLIQAANLNAGTTKSVAACRLILVDGLSINAAARQTDSSPGNVSRMLRKIPRELCPCCGGPVMH